MPVATERQYGPPRRPPVPDVRQPYYGGEDLYRQTENNRQRSVAQGDMLNQELSDYGDDQNYWQQYYRGEGDSAYGEIGEGRGGYREGENADIIGRQGLDDLQMTPEELSSLYLNGGEEDAIRGDPWRAEGWFDPEGLDAINTQNNARIGENVDESGRDIRSTYDDEALSLTPGYRDEVGNIVSGSAGNVRGALQSGASGVRGAINRDRLTLDPNFIKDYRMTDRDVDDFTQEAALTQGNVSAGRADAIRRAAAESGGMSPLALASGINELTSRGDQQANRAMLSARIGARGMQADRLRDVEGMRLDAEGNYANLASDAEMGLSGREAAAEMDLGDREYGAATDYEDLRLNTERDKGDRRYQIADNVADRTRDATVRQGENTREAARYRGETGVALARDTDALQSDRALALATNRQGAERYGQESKYDRNKYRGEALSTRTRAVADPRLAQEKERRAYLAAQQGMANDNVQATYGNRIKNYGQAGQQAQAATGDAMQYDLARRGQSFGTKFKGALGSSLGTFLGNPAQAAKTAGG